MNTRMEDPQRSLERLLANGPLTGWPRRPDDQSLLVRLAAARFEPGRAYRETEVNDVLKEALAQFSAEYGIDHVSMRRALVDAGWLVRDKSGALYEPDPARRPELEALRDLQPATILKQAQEAREARKRQHRKAP
jgi:hypothetical protein